MPAFQVAVRYGVFSLFVLSALVAPASWLVRTRRLSPFGPVGRALRGATEPVLRPVERRLVRLGGNPASPRPDWFVGPLRRLLPTMGPSGWGPLAAGLLLYVFGRMLLAFVAAL